MANLIRIKRSTTQATPSSLEQGELAYSESTGTGDGELFIGIAGASMEVIGGKKYIDIINNLDVNLQTLTVPASTTISAFGATLVDDASASVARTTLGVDAAGTDNSTDVTLTGALDYITIVGQVITRNAIDLTTDITGNLPVANLNSGTTASGSTFWRGDGVWATPAGSGDVSGSGATVNNTIVRWNGTSGTSIQESSITISDTGENLAGVGTLNTHTIPAGTSTFALLTDISTFISSTGVTYEALDTNGDVGTAVGTLAIGNHLHTGVYEPANANIQSHISDGTLHFTQAAISITESQISDLGTYETADATIIKEADLNTSITLVGASDTTAASSLAIKTYVDAVSASEMTYKGGFDPTAAAGAGAPNLNTITSAIGDMYTVTANGTYNFTTGTDPDLVIGDILIAESAGVLSNADSWTIVPATNAGSALAVTDMIAGTGLSGGGDLSADRTFNLNLTSGISLDTDNTTIAGSTDYLVYYDTTGTVHRTITANDLLDGGTF